MSIASVLIRSDEPGSAAPSSPVRPRYSLLLSTDPSMIEAAQRLRYDVFSSTPGFGLSSPDEGHIDVDRFDEYCDHLLVRDDDTGALVGCYRMLAPAGAIAAGGLYTATEFDVHAFDPLRPSLVEMGRAVVREGHRNGGVVLLMWAGILAYLDRCPVQPLRLTYHQIDGSVSTAPAFVGDDTLTRSICRLLTVHRTLAWVRVESLQLPGNDRRDLARRCQSAVLADGPHPSGRRGRRRPRHGHVLVASQT